MNTETFVYIRKYEADPSKPLSFDSINRSDGITEVKFAESWHRIGVIMFNSVDDTTYITASLCAPCDRFNRNRAIGLARSRFNTVYCSLHTTLNKSGISAAYAVDSKIFPRQLLSLDLNELLSKLQILNPLRKYYTVDMEDLDDMVTHELNDHINGKSK